MTSTISSDSDVWQTDADAAVETGSNALGEPVLEIKHLHRFFGRLKAVNDVSFAAYRGQVLGFIGPNGAGKTTTMRILATLDIPTAGDAFICGYSVVDDADKVRRVLGFMPDSFGKYVNTTVVEYLDFFARAYGFRGSRRNDAVAQVMDFTELEALADRPITALSKGMSQRLGLARTLIHDPEVLVLDEPAAGLDPRARVELRELIHLLALRMNKTVLISSHILTELGEICDSVAIIEAGRVLACGTIDEIQRLQRESRGTTDGATLAVRILPENGQTVDRLEKWLLQQALVGNVRVAGSAVAFDFSSDQKMQAALLKSMIVAGYQVIEFQGKSQTLEDAFMALTKGITQ